MDLGRRLHAQVSRDIRRDGVHEAFPESAEVNGQSSAEMTRQVDFPRWELIKWLLPESSRTPAHGGRGRLMSRRSGI